MYLILISYLKSLFRYCMFNVNYNIICKTLKEKVVEHLKGLLFFVTG